ncbi:DUF1576 domain-containing protein [Pisciglobus halotolerans]|uniref:DUF1576 domain-containing protein n=1 Tax=Pisciglobus halotolerans TaxID=745365 RepID=A0A1I3BNJ4_9LACT|nr:DUF1576 domain-containing protein [Pisciglobus halotolerans]SFH63740.1 Protein of unknown function [Pisciglobus halotolerans]
MRTTLNHEQNFAVSNLSDRAIYCLLLVFAGLLFGFAFLFNTPQEIWKGSLTILSSPANLVTDYFALANVGAALVNASLMTLKSLLLIRINKVRLSGPLLAAIITVAGFSLFGKNLYNSIPIIAGVMLYAKLTRSPFKDYLLAALFGSALGPLVSEITFNIGLPLPLGILGGCLAGILVGLLLPPMASHFKSFHKGFSLYNIGFTAGIIGMTFIALFRSFGSDVHTVQILSSGNNVFFSIFLFSLFSSMFVLGFFFNHRSFKGYLTFLDEDGIGGPDYLSKYGLGLTLINMGLLGNTATGYCLLVGGELNGPVIGGIFTVTGFGAFGKHIRNVSPILVGVLLVGLLTSADLGSTNLLLTALFGTTLAPISGHYGALAGIIAGGFHMAMVTNISYLHAGMNLYNNGFSGGFIAAAIVPLLEVFHFHKKERKNQSAISKNIMEEAPSKTSSPEQLAVFDDMD